MPRKSRFPSKASPFGFRLQSQTELMGWIELACILRPLQEPPLVSLKRLFPANNPRQQME